MVLEDLTTNIEKFIDHSVANGFASPHPADVARFQKYGLPSPIRSTAEARARAEAAAAEVAQVLPPDGVVAPDDRDVKKPKKIKKAPFVPEPPKPAAEEDAGEGGSQERRKKHHHSQPAV
jgi:hypothetical protein